jgi:holo-[acyl-carrier protein] synthase
MTETPLVLCGLDAIDLDEFVECLAFGGERFLRRIYTDAERRHCSDRVETLAGRFAAKEAIAKALGSGIRGILWTDLEVLSDPSGNPILILHGPALDAARALFVHDIALCITQSRTRAVATVIMLGTAPAQIGAVRFSGLEFDDHRTAGRQE